MRESGAGPRGLLFILFLQALLWPAGPASGQVVINEIAAAGSDRLLQRNVSGYPKLGLTAPWQTAGYDDALWSKGKGPFGFGTFSNVTFGVNTSAAMQGKLPALYVRKTFTVTDEQAAGTNQLELVTRYNDGFIAFVNGAEVARRNMGNPGLFAYRDQLAFNTNTPHTAAETISLGVVSNRLVAGTNVLCIQTHNKSLTGIDANTFLSMADLRVAGSAPVTLVASTNEWKYFAGLAEPSGGLIDYGLLKGIPVTAAWATLGYNDASWAEASGPFGYDRNVPVHYLLGTNLSGQVYNLAASVYARTLFSATPAEAASDEPLQLVIDYDDGLIVYLNGREVARRNVGTANTITPCGTLATASHGANGEGGATGRDEVLSLGAANTLLSGGDNVLCVQIHNNALTSSDLIGKATLSTTGAGARVLTRPTDAGRYFIGTREPLDVEAGEDSDAADDTPDSEGDWVELYNPGSDAANLTGWSLTDDEGKPRKWYFPAGSSIPAGGYLIVMATGFDVGPANGATYLHTNFKLSSGGEYLGLVDAAGAVVSEIAPGYPAQSHFHSYARTGAGPFVFSDTATPGAANTGTVYTAMTAPPEFSHLGGFFSAPFSLQLAAPDPAAAVRYTTDGSEPMATNGTAYSGPVAVNTNTVIRARCFRTGEVPSATRTHTYLVSQSAARRSIPAICINADPKLGLYGPNASGGPADGQGVMAIKGGSYTNGVWYHNGDPAAFNMPSLLGRAAEKPASLEFYPTNSTPPLRTDFGLRLSGSPYQRPRYTLTDKPSAIFNPASSVQKPSFNFFFRGELGDSPQDYPFFPDNPVTSFGDVRLRSGKNDNQNPFIRDELMRRIFIGTGQQGSRGIFTTLYLNGVFKGYYNLCEHLREKFMQEHHNSSAAWDVQQVGDFVSGDAINWNSMVKYLRTNDLASVTAYRGVQGLLDVDNVIDYLLVNTYAATWDWPNNNWVAARERSEAGRWRFYMWDGEGGFGTSGRTNSNYDSFSADLNIGAAAKTTTGAYIPAIYTLLRASPEFRLRFADRAQKHFFHGGCLTPASMESVFVPLRDAVNPIMKETINQYMNTSFYTNWIATDVRRTTLFTQLTNYGLWVPTLAPEFGQHGGALAAGAAVSITNLNAGGTVYFTTNGVDPRMLGGAATGLLYTAPVPIAATSVLMARVLSAGGEWSPLQEAAFVVPVPVPEFLPSGSADWTASANWNSNPSPYPGGTNAAARINAPAAADRDVGLRAPVMIGTLEVNQGNAPYRNKIRDRGTGNTLTFLSTNGPALLTVTGAGTGYVEFEVAADAVLASDLRLEVDDTAATSEYGALRLRSVWRGPGGLIKEGDGVASLTGDGKVYTGATVINRGVLQLTQSATPTQSAAVAVNPGGQLRLTSASTAGEPRVHAFGGALRLDSQGRGGARPQVSGLGILGGVRYQPDSDDSWAVIANSVVFAGASSIHVEGTRNRLDLTAPLAGAFGFTKTGGGNLVLGADSAGYLAPVTVSNGTLTVNGRIASAVDVADGALLSGSGRAGPLAGTGSVALDGTLLTAASARGLQYAFSFATRGAPAYAAAAASGNGLLRVQSLQAAESPSRIDLYLDTPLLAAGDRLRGGFFVDDGGGLAGFLAAATVRFFVPDSAGAQTFAGRSYSPYAGPLPLTATAMPATADFGDGPRNGQVMELRVAGPPVRYDEWLRQQFPDPEDQGNPQVAGPLAKPFNDGVANLLRYAFDIGPGARAPDLMPRFGLDDGTPGYSFRFDPGKNDLVYRVEASPDLSDWSRVLFDSSTDEPELWDGETLILHDDGYGPHAFGKQFYRLRILLNTP